MAKSRKNTSPPSTTVQNVVAPASISPLMQAFHVDSDCAAKALIQEAAKAIYGNDDFIGSHHEVSNQEIEGTISLMRSIKPQDTLETLYAAQIIASHLLGMRKLSSSFQDDQRLGLKLLRFSNEALQHLDRKRNGGAQNINVNYNYYGQGSAIMQTVIPQSKGEPCLLAE